MVYSFFDCLFSEAPAADYDALLYIFDPSSIEVDLNPEVFPESEIEWFQVDATCVGTQEIGMAGTDQYRNALGLASRSARADFDPIFPKYYQGQDVFWNSVADLFDFLYYGEKGDMKYPSTIYQEVVDGDPRLRIRGCGYEGGYAIEPAVMVK